MRAGKILIPSPVGGPDSDPCPSPQASTRALCGTAPSGPLPGTPHPICSPPPCAWLTKIRFFHEELTPLSLEGTVRTWFFRRSFVVGPLAVGVIRWRNVKSLSRVRLFATLWTVAYQAPLSMGFSRQEDWRGLTFPSPGNLPHPGIEPGSPALRAGAFRLNHQGSL